MISADSGRFGHGARAASGMGAGVLGCAGLSLLLGLSYGFASSAGLHIGADASLSALAWPAPAMGVALLWRRPVREWPVYLLAAGAALVLVSTAMGHVPTTIDLGLAAVGLAEVALGAWLGRRWVAPDGQLDSSRRLLLFTLMLPAAVSLLHAALSSVLLRWGGDADWVEPLRRIYVANALAMLILAPALLTWGAPNVRAVLRDRGNWQPAACALACLALAFVPRMHDEVVRTMLTLPLCWAAVRSGMVLVAPLNAAISIGMIAITLGGFGPYFEYGYGLWTLQVDLIGMAVLSLMLAVTIGERRRLAARLEQARRFESLGFLAGGVAHDFNNVLGTIRACAEIAADRMPPGSPGRAEIAQMERETERGIDMTQQILLAARQGDPARGRVDLSEVVDEVIEMARALCPVHVRIARAAEPGVPASAPAPLVLANRGQLVRAVQNLLRNATQAARREVTLTVGRQVSAGQRDGRFDVHLGDPQAADRARGWVEVADDGAGIDAAHWPHLFDPFYSTRLVQGGSGLGLAIVAGIASGHGGFIGMRTQAGRGTIFRLELPLFEAADPQGSAQAPTTTSMKE
jgi:signal transduction histidine kinase